MKTTKAILFALVASFAVMACSHVHAADTPAAAGITTPAPAVAVEPELSRFEKCQQNATDLVATQACLAEEKKAVEEELEATLTKAATTAAETDKSVPGYEVATKLEAANKSFKKYVEDQCAYEMAVYTNGTLASPAYVACVTTLTKQRNDLIGPDQFSAK